MGNISNFIIKISSFYNLAMRATAAPVPIMKANIQ